MFCIFDFINSIRFSRVFIIVIVYIFLLLRIIDFFDINNSSLVGFIKFYHKRMAMSMKVFKIKIEFAAIYLCINI